MKQYLHASKLNFIFVLRLTENSEVPISIPGPATYFRLSFRDFKKGSFQLLSKILVYRFGGLNLPRNNVIRLADRPDMAQAAYRGHIATTYNTKTTINFAILFCLKIMDILLKLVPIYRTQNLESACHLL